MAYDVNDACSLAARKEKKERAEGIKYPPHVQTYGWLDWVKDGELAGTTGESKRLEAIEIKLVAK